MAGSLMALNRVEECARVGGCVGEGWEGYARGIINDRVTGQESGGRF